MGTVVGTGVLLLVMTACGSAQLGSGSSAGGSSDGSSPTLGTSNPVQPPGIAPGEIPPDGKPVSLSKVDASALAPEYPKTVWTQGDGRTVGVIGQEGGCGKVSAHVLAQDASAVKIELLETLPLEKKMCTMDIRFPPLTVALDQPLGDRTVVLSSRQEQK